MGRDEEHPGKKPRPDGSEYQHRNIPIERRFMYRISVAAHLRPHSLSEKPLVGSAPLWALSMAGGLEGRKTVHNPAECGDISRMIFHSLCRAPRSRGVPQPWRPAPCTGAVRGRLPLWARRPLRTRAVAPSRLGAHRACIFLTLGRPLMQKR